MLDASNRPDPQRRPASPEAVHPLRHLVLSLGALAVLSVLCGTALSLWRMHEEVVQRAEEHLRGLSQVLGVQVLRSTQTIDTILAATAEDAQRAVMHGRIVGSAMLQKHLADSVSSTPHVRALILADTHGRVLAHTGTAPRPAQVADAEYFRTHQLHASTRIHISAPAGGKASGGLSIPISRRINDPFGNFIGVIAVEIDPAYFLWSQSLQEIGPEGTVRLMRRDGTLLTGYPLAIAAALGNYRDTAYFVQGVEAGRSLIRHQGVVVRGDRISALHKLEDYPLVLSVTTSVDFVLQAWRHSAWLFGGIAALTALFLGMITLVLARQLGIDAGLKAAVAESEERLQAVIQSAMDAIVLLDEDQRIVLFNAAAEQIFCCPSAEAIGAPIKRYIPGDLLTPLPAPELKPDAGDHAMRRMGQHLALSGVRAGGARFPIDASVSRVRLHGTNLYIVILRDITERKQVEAALRENEQRYRALFSQAMDGILLVDATGNVVSVNESFARMHGYEVDELLDMNLRQLDTPATLAATPERISRILAGESMRFEVERFHKDGHIVPVEVATSCIDIGGRPHILAFHRDITARRRTEQELRRSQQELRGLSKAANEALEAERRRTARELHDELGQLLTALKMDLESLRAALPPDAPDLGKRAQTMHSVLDATIAATRRIASDLRPLMLDDLGLAAALDWLTQNFSKQTGIATDLVIDDAVAQVPEPIASTLYRITQESLTNVTKYAQASKTEIRLEQDGEWVRLSVRDNGRGIAEGDRNKHGTFGLLGIRERVMLLSGEVTIRGEPGRGSEVCARIPLSAAQLMGTSA